MITDSDTISRSVSMYCGFKLLTGRSDEYQLNITPTVVSARRPRRSLSVMSNVATGAEAMERLRIVPEMGPGEMGLGQMMRLNLVCLLFVLQCLWAPIGNAQQPQSLRR